jgi:hypothetical protein
MAQPFLYAPAIKVRQTGWVAKSNKSAGAPPVSILLIA